MSGAGSATQSLKRPGRQRPRWTATKRAEIVLEVLRGERSLGEASRRYGVDLRTLGRWREQFLEAGRRGLDERYAPAETGAHQRQARRVFQDVAEAVGDTPLVRLNRVVSPVAGEVYAKLEFMNPCGSIKDRVAKHLIEVAAADGRLRPGDTVVEASSGNTALGLGMMAVLKGYRCKVVVRDRTSAEKIRSLRALGVEVEVVPGDLPPEHPESYNRVMERVVAETPDCYFPDQHNNRENNEAHYASTGPEIWEQMEGRIDAFVAGMGTGGTISGVARYLKEQDPTIQVVGVDPVGSVFTPYFHTGRQVEPGPYLLEGLGDEELIACPEFELIDWMVQVPCREAFACARELAKQEAIMAGGSAGAALWAVRKLQERLGRPARIVTVFPDGANRYLSTFFSDEWLAEKGLLPL